MTLTAQLSEVEKHVIQSMLAPHVDAHQLEGDSRLDINTNGRNQGIILVFDESLYKNHPKKPPYNLRLVGENTVYELWLITSPVIYYPEHPDYNKEHHEHFQKCEHFLAKTAHARSSHSTIPNPFHHLNAYDISVGTTHRYQLIELFDAYRAMAAHNKAMGPTRGGEARGRQKTDLAERITIARIESAIEELRFAGVLPTQEQVAKEAGCSKRTVQRHWKHPRVRRALDS